MAEILNDRVIGQSNIQSSRWFSLRYTFLNNFFHALNLHLKKVTRPNKQSTYKKSVDKIQDPWTIQYEHDD
jgi:hypothetical protein